MEAMIRPYRVASGTTRQEAPPVRLSRVYSGLGGASS
jgi:hypothetical protein